jgi:hypothetical protein
MRVIAFIEQAGVIRKILKHLGLWGNRRKPDPRANAPPALCVVEDVGGYLPTPDDKMFDPFYPVDTYFYSCFAGPRRCSPENRSHTQLGRKYRLDTGCGRSV